MRNATKRIKKTNGVAPKRRGPERDLYMVELILKGSGPDYSAQRRTILSMLYAFSTARYSQSPDR